MSSTGHFTATAICLKATIGDRGNALVAYGCAVYSSKDRHWMIMARMVSPVVFVTVGLKYINTDALDL